MLSIIIPTYNGLSLVKKNIFSWLKLKNNSHEHIEIILVDNASIDQTSSFIKQNYPDINYHYLNKNKGFTTACNYGAKKAKGDYLLFLNNDCLIDSSNLNKLIKFLQNNPQYIATQPIILNNDKKTIQNIGYKVDLKRAKAKVVISRKKITEVNFDKELFIQTNSFYGLSATCLLIKKEIFLKIGGFDDGFHSYLEDIDLFFSLYKQGYKYAPCLEATCIHDHMATSSKMGHYKVWQDVKNWWRVILKHYPLYYFIKHSPSLMLERFKNISGAFKSYLP